MRARRNPLRSPAVIGLANRSRMSAFPESGRSNLIEIVKLTGRFRPQADIAHHKFHRLDEPAPGHGIGLAIVKDIARSYGGDLTIQVSDLGGAEIKMTIPPAPGP